MSVLSLTPYIVVAADVFVATTGSDRDPGTLEAPFRTLQRAARQLTPGNTCYIRGGRYADMLALAGRAGLPGKPLMFKAYRGERVVLDGSIAVTSEWTRHRGNIFRTTLERDMWQLFLDDEILTAARFPDARWGDGTIWDVKASCRHLAPGSRPGLMVDERPPASDAASRDFDEGAEEGWAKLEHHANTVSLAESGIDFTGAVAIMHIGSWLSWAQEVESHRPGSDRFTYSLDFSRSGIMANAAKRFLTNEAFFKRKNLQAGQGYYFLEGLQCLDRPGEWYYTPSDRTLYCWAPDGGDPTGRDLRGKVRDYSVTASDCSYVAFQGLSFFASTFRFTNSSHMVVEDCRFDYPSYNRFVLGDFRRPAVGGFECLRDEEDEVVLGPESNSRNSVIRNCEFRCMDGPALDIEGEDHVVENCLFSEVDYTCLGTGAEGTINLIRSIGTVFRRNTIHTAGNSEGIRGGFRGLIESNHVFNTSLIQHDGSQINLGVDAQNGSVVRRNWSHHSAKAAIRFDSTGMGDPASVNYGVRGTVTDNVTWSTGPAKIKGDNHVAMGNTLLHGRGENGVTLTVLDNPAMGGLNAGTITKNNVGVLSGHFRYLEPLPGEADHNLMLSAEAKAGDLFRDPANLDFRPRRRSPLVDAGVVVAGVSKRYEGRAPDIGAYEYGAETYWIPGRRAPQASTPVPPDGSVTVNPDADLMWLDGYQADEHHLYFGTDGRAVEQAGNTSPQYRGSRASNIFHPQALVPGWVYYWRVDAVRGARVIPGKTWRFKVRKDERARTTPANEQRRRDER